MNKDLLKGFDYIHANEELKQRTINNIVGYKKQTKIIHYKWVSAIATVILLISSYTFFQNRELNDNDPTNVPYITKDGGVHIPNIDISLENHETADMIGLIVYKGEIYIQTFTEIDPEHAKQLLGEKIGTTKANIDEWSDQSQYEIELASTIGKEDVYTVKGYDPAFRLMTYTEGKDVYPQFFEKLHNITVYSGKDVFGYLNLIGRVQEASYRNFDEWDQSIENYHPIQNMNIVQTFLKELNHTTPYLYESVQHKLESSRNNEQFRELTLLLEDHTKVKLHLLKDGYISYGHTGIYFKMDEHIFHQLWNELE